MPTAFVRRWAAPSSETHLAYGLLALASSRERLDQLLNTDRPGNSASAPSASSIRSSWLYFATRSDRDGAPVLIWPQPVATARSAIVVSSVSPERCDITAV